jgi:PKHD-type hydroxylase
MRGVAKRRDLAVSVALNDDYEGGELAFKFGSLETPLRLRAGQAVVFPAQLAHKVQPVTSGERLVAILWVTSRIPDAMEREIVISLQRAQELCLSDAPEDRAELVDVLAFGTQNLLKRWLR